MDYLEKLIEVLQRATVEEIFMVLRFAENVVVRKRKMGEEDKERGRTGEDEQARKKCSAIHS